MMTGKNFWMAGTAMFAVLASGTVAYAQDAQPATNAELEQRISALESEVQQSEVNAAQAANTPPVLPSGWWNNTSISGRMYFDATNISNKSNGVKVNTATVAATGVTNANGTNFDVKRVYIGVDHTFSDMFSANVTTDTSYDGTTGVGQIFLKKAYLQAKVDPALTIRLGAADLPWIPYAESIYGMRWYEKTITDGPAGTSSDWGIHALGSFFDGILNYDIAAINGGGYKKTPIGGDVNRFKQFDFEGRVNATYEGFNVAVGGYTGKLGTAYGTTTFHTANRFNALAAYVANGLRVGVEYFNATDYSAALVSTAGPGDSMNGISGFASYYFLPEFAVFGRYDHVDPNAKTAPTRTSNYYTFGFTWTPVKTVDMSIAYKHDGVSHGTFSSANGTIGGTTNGSYNEVGLFGDWQF